MTAVQKQEVEMTETPQKTKENRKKSSLKWLFIIPSFLLIPFLLLLLVFLILFVAIVISISDDENYLSEYGEGVIPPEFIPIYQEAGEKYGVDWILLAAIHDIETDFSQNLEVSSAGAIGHTQFMKCTWIGWGYPGCSTAPKSVYTNLNTIKQYGGYGVDANGNGKADPWEIEDSIHATAKYISSNMVGNTEEERIRNALFSYNHADWYVEEVLTAYRMYSAGGFGEFVQIKGDKAWVVPYTTNITSYYGMRSGKMHKGIDISSGGVFGTPVVAFMDGTVTYSQYNNGGYGYLVIIQHADNVTTYYAHLSQQGIPVGSKVKAGQVIGYVGNTGDSTGPHLHFEIRIKGNAVNPLPYVSEFLK